MYNKKDYSLYQAGLFNIPGHKLPSMPAGIACSPHRIRIHCLDFEN